MAIDDSASLRQRIEQLEAELAAVKQKNAELERTKGGAVAEVVGDPAIPISEFEETLKRLVQRIAMILQAEKCVIMIRDRETGDLIARSPAFGMSDEDVKTYRVHPDKGISGEVFREGNPVIFHDVAKDPHAAAENLARWRVRNGVTVPLMIEKRDDQNHIVDRVMVGVLHCFNKRYGGEFIEEDVRLLERLSRNAAAVIANAQMFREVVEERQKLVHTLESLTAGLILVNQHGRIGQMNAQARAMFGVPKGDDPISKPLADVIRHEQCAEIIARQIAEAQSNASSNGNASEDAEPKPPDEISIKDENDYEYIYQLHSAKVLDDEQQPIGTVVIFNDITDIRNVERMKTEFVSIVSHELRTPLTPMKGFVRTLLDDENEEWYTLEDRREFYNIIEENVDRLTRLITDLLNVSRIERLGASGIEMNWEEVDLRKATEDVVAIQKARTDKHTLLLDFEPEQICVETDPDKIQNILQNLVSNAIKYSPGGEVRLIGRLEAPSEEFPTGSVLIGVKDQGLGIAEPDLKKLFKKFGRVGGKDSKKQQGTGIGLFLVKNLVEAHKGSIWPESEGLGKGSTFWMRIPTKQQHEEEQEECEHAPQ